MSEKVKDTNINKDETSLSFLKVDKIKRGSHGLNLLLRPDDILVALDKNILRTTPKVFYQKIRENDESLITVYRKNFFFNVKLKQSLGISLLETNTDEDTELLEKSKSYINTLQEIKDFKDYEVYKGKKNLYNEIEVKDISLLASSLPFIWFFHHKLFNPLLLLVATFILLGSIAWWLLLSAWIILSIYMSKSSMSLLRGYCLFNEMKIYMKLCAKDNLQVQELLREVDPKSNYIFPLIEKPVINGDKEEANSNNDISAASTQPT